MSLSISFGMRTGSAELATWDDATFYDDGRFYDDISPLFITSEARGEFTGIVVPFVISLIFSKFLMEALNLRSNTPFSPFKGNMISSFCTI